jgi:predicted  nucleic acid-binding Zn-ribbon protein
MELRRDSVDRNAKNEPCYHRPKNVIEWEDVMSPGDWQIRSAVLLVSILAAAATGCTPRGAETEISDLRRTNADLSSQLDAANRRIEDSELRIAALEAEMVAFTEAYDSAKRSQLSENIDSIEQALNDLRSNLDLAAATLRETEALQAEIAKLKDLCVKHEAEASDANQVGQLKTSLKALELSVTNLERSVGVVPNIGMKVRQLESEIRRLESKVRRIR